MINKYSFLLLCLFFLFSTQTTKAQLSAGVSLGRFHKADTTYKFNGSLGVSIRAIYRVKNIRFGASYSFIGDMPIDEEKILADVLGNSVVNNSAKIAFDPALSFMAQYELMNKVDRINFFLGVETGLYKYDETGEIQIEIEGAGGPEVITIMLDEEPRKDVLLFAKANVEFEASQAINIFLGINLPLLSKFDRIVNGQIGIHYNIIKSEPSY